MMNEIKCAVNQIWGMNESQFKHVNLDETIKIIIIRVLNRALVNFSLCEFNLEF